MEGNEFTIGERVRVVNVDDMGKNVVHFTVGDIVTVISKQDGWMICRGHTGDGWFAITQWLRLCQLENIGPSQRLKFTVTPGIGVSSSDYTSLLSYPSSPCISTTKKSTGGSIMDKLSLIAKKTLDADTRTLINAGVLNQRLEVENTDLVIEFIVDKFKAELADLARKQMTEEKADAPKSKGGSC